MTFPEVSKHTTAVTTIALLILFFSCTSGPVVFAPSVVASASELALKLEQRTLKQSGDRWLVEIEYPQVDGVDGFNEAISQHVTKVANDFRSTLPNSAWKEFPASGAYLKGRYKAHVLENGIISVLFSYDEYTPGAAHPWGVLASIAYDTHQNRVLALSDLFRPKSDYLSRLSRIAIEELGKREFAEKEHIRVGAAPSEHNFSVFTLTNSELVLHFQQYQVAAGAAGEPEPVVIPLTSLGRLLRERYRAALK